MKGVYGQFKRMTGNETAAVIAITVAVVVAYSVWGAYLLRAADATSPHTITIGQ